MAKKFKAMHNICFQISEFIPIITGVYLFTALHFIRKYKRNEVQINAKVMTLHAASFALYMASILLWIYGYDSKKIHVKTELICGGIVDICSSLSQVVLCIIFWDLGKKRQPQQRQELPAITNKNVEVEDEDDDAWIKRKRANKIPITEV